MTSIAAPPRYSSTGLQVGRYLLLGLAATMLSCAPGDVKAGLGPNEPDAAVVVLAPTQDSIVVGQVVLIAASARTSTGQPATAEIDWSADGGTLIALTDSTAQFSAASVGSYTVRGRGRRAPHPKDSTVIVVDTPVSPVVSLSVAPASVALGVGGIQAFVVTATRQDGTTMIPSVTWSATGGTIDPAGIYSVGNSAGTYRVIATQQGGTLADTATITISTTGPGTALLSEGFESGNLAANGWFDETTVTVVPGTRPGGSGTNALQWHWTTGSVAPQGASRFDFTPSNTLYLSYWVKQSSNWIGSGKSYHPHMFQILTTADDHWIGPSRTHLTVLHELIYQPGQGGSLVNQSLQDPLNIDLDNLLVDLSGVTERRAVSGYNGRPESGLVWDEYFFGGVPYNGKMARSNVLVMTDATKNSWHHVEGFWKLNSIVGGRGQPDGVVQAWFDGVLVVDRHDIYFRTGANPSMQFRTFVLASYIGDGSPVDQYMWLDDLLLATAKP